jgi:catalase
MQTISNKPKYSYNPTRRDGAGVVDNLQDLPNYIPGDQDQVTILTKDYEAAAHEQWIGTVTSFDSVVTADDYVQPRDFWENTLGTDPAQQERLVGNVAASLSKALPNIRQDAYGKSFQLDASDLELTFSIADIFTKINKDLGARIKAKTEAMAKAPAEHNVTNHFLL